MTSLNPSSKKTSVAISLILLIFHIAFFYLYSINLKGVLFSIFYFIFVVVIPGYFIFLLSTVFLSSKIDKEIDRYLIISLSVTLGIANVLFSYLIGQIADIFFINYIFIWPFFLVFLKNGRIEFSRRIDALYNNHDHKNPWEWPIILFFSLLLNIYFFAMRPTPGIIPVGIFHDHLWNAGNTVSLMSGFPLQSIRIESMPYLAYHILIHIIGAHMALLTGLIPHMVGLQYVFIPFVPLLIYSMVALLRQFFVGYHSYLIYGLILLLFGGGFGVVHEVKVLSLIGSSTNFLGVILMFLFLTIFLNLQLFNSTGRLLILFTCLFIATAAKGSIGISLCGGLLIWWLFRVYKRTFTWSNTFEIIGGSIGFLSSYYLFFIWPVLGQQFNNIAVRSGSFPIIPFGYVTKNSLTYSFVNNIDKYLSGMSQIAAHIGLTALMLPVYILLYYSYRLLVFYYFKNYYIDKAKQKVLAFAFSSLLIGHMINFSGSQDYAYILTVAVYCLDVLFILFIVEEKVFIKLREFFITKNIFAFIGLTVILLLPFVDLQNRFRDEHIYNYIFTGKIGQLLNRKLENTNYRKTRQYITPEVYDALSYIRQHTQKDSIVVTSFVKLPNGRPLSFWVSTFSERTVFVEGYFSIGGLACSADSNLVNEKIDTISRIYSSYKVPASMKGSPYLFLIKVDDLEEFEKEQKLTVTYRNNEFAVVRF